MLSDEQIKSLVLSANLVSEQQLLETSSFARTVGHSLQDALVEKGLITPEALGNLVASFLKMPYVGLAKVQIPEEVINLVPPRIARKYKMVAFLHDNGNLSIAVEDTPNPELLDLITRKTGLKVILHYSSMREIENAMQFYKKDIQKTVDLLLKEDTGSFGSQDLPDLPVAKIVDTLLEFAYDDKASDVHIEPQEKDAIVRFRIDGVLQDVLTVSRDLHDRILTRIKVLSALRTDEHMSAQDGKMQQQMEDETLDVRVSIVPIADGEKVELRLLSSRSRQFSLADLGMVEKDLEKVTRAYKRSFGMLLSTGPTGSGKTTSIYAMLKTLNERGNNITTIEDPVEYRIKGANQIQVNVKTNLTFANGLRSILRQDPNIIFVGEIRDSETAGIAVNAALTGHLVFSTLHTNDAATTIPRLIDMKVEPFLVASTISVIIAQRLLRRTCDICKQPVVITQAELLKNFPEDMVKRHFAANATGEVQIFHGVGCKTCRNSGYVGRLGIFEVLEVTKSIRELIIKRSDADLIAQAAIKEGMTTILDDGLDKVAKGITTLEEVLRVTKTELV
ncbi:MAG TPA: ATPase, T2SS/T4P/T4SS family [Candidatus Saccharimonadia bacterium]|nr:ATPase, T2SS/T4P/T4SS family [Candidatus Saccharimonadia bacterium]